MIYLLQENMNKRGGEVAIWRGYGGGREIVMQLPHK